MTIESDGVGRLAMDDKSFRNKVKQLIVESCASDLQSFCYWTLYHAFHLWKHEPDAFTNVRKDDTESEMSAAKCLVELKTQSEITNIDAIAPPLQEKQLPDDSNSANKLKPIPKAVSESKYISEGPSVINHGNVLFPSDCVMLSSSEQVQESASESPVSVVFPWSPAVWTQGINGAFETTNIEDIFTNEEEKARNNRFLAGTSKGLVQQEVQREHPCTEINSDGCFGINLEVFLGDMNELTSESILMYDAAKPPHVGTSCANVSANDAMEIGSSIKSANLEKDHHKSVESVNLKENYDKIPVQLRESGRDSIAFSAWRTTKKRTRFKRKRRCC